MEESIIKPEMIKMETAKASMSCEEVKALNNQKLMDKINKETEDSTDIDILKLILAELIKINKKIR